MGQVPDTEHSPLLLVGNGRLARHLGRYLGLEGVPFSTWCRGSVVPFDELRDRSERVALLISDDAIEGFLERHRDGDRRLWIHFSGSLSTPLAEGAHPLMTFGPELYDLDTYRRVPFVCERGRRPFGELFPGLGNPSFTVEPADKALYHALCVLAGNGTTLLWRKAFAGFERLGLPRESLMPYLERVAANLAASDDPLTGPLPRGDRQTIERNLDALGGDPYRAVYRALADAHLETP
jgi:2-dehydropantoate 2-reductase